MVAAVRYVAAFLTGLVVTTLAPLGITGESTLTEVIHILVGAGAAVLAYRYMPIGKK